MRELTAFWNADVGLDPLLEGADDDPVAAALWEVVWRLEPRANEALGFRGLPSPNPYLAEHDDGSREELMDWPRVVDERDPDAAALLASAIRAERDLEWPDAERILGRYRWALETLPSDTAQIERLQEAMTRLLLVGDPTVSLDLIAGHADLVLEEMREVEPSEHDELLLDMFVPPFVLAVERLVGVGAIDPLTSFQGIVERMRSAGLSKEADEVLNRVSRRLDAFLSSRERARPPDPVI